MKTILILTTIIFCCSLLLSCDQGAHSPRGFSLPEGDADAGKQVFIQHQCLSCHTLKGVEDKSVELELQKTVALGGESVRITTYAELVTSIINPSHKLSRGYRLNTTDVTGKSKMRNFNDALTVTELVDLVTFLQPQYKVKPITYTQYGKYVYDY